MELRRFRVEIESVNSAIVHFVRRQSSSVLKFCQINTVVGK